MNITIEMIEQVLDETGAEYRAVKQALIDAEGDVEEAIKAVKESASKIVEMEPKEEEGQDAEGEETITDEEDPDWTSDEYADRMVERLKKKVKDGNVDRIRITKGENVIMDIPVNVGIVGGLIGLVTIPWALILGAVAAYGLNCKIEVITKDGESEEVE